MPSTESCAIFFDLDGTLLVNRVSPVTRFFDFCARLGHTFDEAAPRRLERWQHEYWSRRDWITADLEQHGEAHFWRRYNERQLTTVGAIGPLADHAAQMDAWFRAEFTPDALVPPDVRDTLLHLRQHGWVVGLVSNRTDDLTPIAETHGLDDLFDFTLSAGQAGAWKPDPAIFLRAAQLADVLPEQAVYVGDNYFADVVGAQGAGLIPVLIDPRHVFPDADCRVIHAIAELRSLAAEGRAVSIHLTDLR